ncbi:MAG: hypothetical protein CL607_09475 [Anaerolineaceae bacterium]|nr:hypothetical protein [Anaerolineaceae bacterium]
MTMTRNDMIRYLAAALDQEACKATLMAALWSRVDALRDKDIADRQIISSLNAISDDPYQLNEDVICDVIEDMILCPQIR